MERSGMVMITDFKKMGGGAWCHDLRDLMVLTIAGCSALRPYVFHILGLLKQ